MKHCILAKWNENVTDKAALLPPIAALFSTADTIPGVHGVEIYPCCICRRASSKLRERVCAVMEIPVPKRMISKICFICQVYRLG